MKEKSKERGNPFPISGHRKKRENVHTEGVSGKVTAKEKTVKISRPEVSSVFTARWGSRTRKCRCPHFKDRKAQLPTRIEVRPGKPRAGTAASKTSEKSKAKKKRLGTERCLNGLEAGVKQFVGGVVGVGGGEVLGGVGGL